MERVCSIVQSEEKSVHSDHAIIASILSSGVAVFVNEVATPRRTVHEIYLVYHADIPMYLAQNLQSTGPLHNDYNLPDVKSFGLYTKDDLKFLLSTWPLAGYKLDKTALRIACGFCAPRTVDLFENVDAATLNQVKKNVHQVLEIDLQCSDKLLNQLVSALCNSRWSRAVQFVNQTASKSFAVLFDKHDMMIAWRPEEPLSEADEKTRSRFSVDLKKMTTVMLSLIENGYVHMNSVTYFSSP